MWRGFSLPFSISNLLMAFFGALHQITFVSIIILYRKFKTTACLVIPLLHPTTLLQHPQTPSAFEFCQDKSKILTSGFSISSYRPVKFNRVNDKLSQISCGELT